jgi:deoxyribodipyrimidine photo-lyase
LKKKLKRYTQKNSDLINSSSTLFWFRRDLRLQDNAGLYHALKENKEVVPIFIFDTSILNNLKDNTDRRVEFIHHSLTLLQHQLVALGSSLLVFHGNPLDIFKTLKPKAVYTNHDYEPYARKRDEDVKTILSKNQIEFKTFKDLVIFEKGEVTKEDGKPYTIFTPYSRKWKSLLTPANLKSYPTEKYFNSFKKINEVPLPALKEIGFEKTGLPFPERIIKQNIVEKYDQQRNFPAMEGTTG